MLRYIEACEEKDWHLRVWHPRDPGATGMKVPYSCGSWRHKGECQAWKAAQDYARIEEAMLRWGNWSFFVLTMDHKKYPDPWTEYRLGYHHWSRLRKRLERGWGTIRYIQTWERHRRGGAHLNIAISSETIHQELEANLFPLAGQARKNAAKKIRWVIDLAQSCGFGWQCYADILSGQAGGLAAYLAKKSAELVGAAKKAGDQIPYDAPRHFRRLRASRGCLPPVAKGEYTGQLVFAPLPGDIVKEGENHSVHLDTQGENMDNDSCCTTLQNKGEIT